MPKGDRRFVGCHGCVSSWCAVHRECVRGRNITALQAPAALPQPTDEARAEGVVEAALIIGGILDCGMQDNLVKRARKWLDNHPTVEAAALSSLSPDEGGGEE